MNRIQRTGGLLAALCCLIGVASASAFDQPKIYALKPKDHVRIYGDSTTADGVARAGYVPLTDQAQREQVPDLGALVTGQGASGSTAGDWLRGIGQTLTQDLKKDQPPTVVMINLGLNDSKSGPQGATAYGDNLRGLVKEIRQRNLTAILCTPTTWGGLTQTQPYAEAARMVAAELKCPLIDLYAVHADHITANTKDGRRLPGTDPTRDGTHLTVVGEILSAGAILQAFGLRPEWKEYQLRIGVGRHPNKRIGGNATIKVEPDLPKYPAGSKVTLICTPSEGMAFYRWSRFNGDNAGEQSRLTLTMDAHMHILGTIQASEKAK